MYEEIKDELVSILNKKTLIKTKFENRYNWINTFTKKYYDDFIEVEYIDDYIKNILVIGDNLVCKVATADFVYIFRVKVYDVKVLTNSLILSIIDASKIRNTRDSQRFDVYLVANLLTDQNLEGYYSIILNASNFGLSLATNAQLSVSQIIDLSIYKSKNEVIDMNCEIKWKSTLGNGNLYGLKINQISEVHRLLYEKLIQQIQSEEK